MVKSGFADKPPGLVDPVAVDHDAARNDAERTFEYAHVGVGDKMLDA